MQAKKNYSRASGITIFGDAQCAVAGLAPSGAHFQPHPFARGHNVAG